MKQLRIGLVGLGYFGQVHYEVLSALDGVEVVAVSEIDPKRFEQYPLPPSVARYHDAPKMLAEKEFDVLDVVATEEVHYELVRQGLKAGREVIVEKPFTQSSEHARDLIETASRSGLHLYVGQILRFDARYRMLRDSLQTKRQPIRHISLQRHFTAQDHVIYGRIDPFLVSCVHDIDLAIYLCERPVRRVYASTKAWLGRANPDVAIGILEWEDGLRAVMQNVWHLNGGPWGDDMETKVFADGTTYVVRNEPVLQSWEPEAKLSVPEFFYWPVVAGERRGAIYEELRHFIQCIRQGIATPIVPLDEIQNGIDTAQALIRSARSGQVETV